MKSKAACAPGSGRARPGPRLEAGGHLLQEGDQLARGELVQLAGVLHLVELPVQMLDLLLQLEVLLGVCHLLELPELLPELEVAGVQLLALQPHLQRLQLLGRKLGRQRLGAQVVRQVLLGDAAVLVVILQVWF